MWRGASARIPSSQGAYKAGKLRYIAVAAPKRMPQMPEVPTVAEAGGPAGLEVNSFVVLVAPRGLPAAVRTKINADVQKALDEAGREGALRHLRLREHRAGRPQEIDRTGGGRSRSIYAELVKRKNISLE